jgi:hypothetical protein
LRQLEKELKKEEARKVTARNREEIASKISYLEDLLKLIRTDPNKVDELIRGSGFLRMADDGVGDLMEEGNSDDNMPHSSSHRSNTPSRGGGGGSEESFDTKARDGTRRSSRSRRARSSIYGDEGEDLSDSAGLEYGGRSQQAVHSLYAPQTVHQRAARRARAEEERVMQNVGVLKESVPVLSQNELSARESAVTLLKSVNIPVSILPANDEALNESREELYELFPVVALPAETFAQVIDLSRDRFLPYRLAYLKDELLRESGGNSKMGTPELAPIPVPSKPSFSISNSTSSVNLRGITAPAAGLPSTADLVTWAEKWREDDPAGLSQATVNNNSSNSNAILSLPPFNVGVEMGSNGVGEGKMATPVFFSKNNNDNAEKEKRSSSSSGQNGNGNGNATALMPPADGVLPPTLGNLDLWMEESSRQKAEDRQVTRKRQLSRMQDTDSVSGTDVEGSDVPVSAGKLSKSPDAGNAGSSSPLKSSLPKVDGVEDTEGAEGTDGNGGESSKDKRLKLANGTLRSDDASEELGTIALRTVVSREDLSEVEIHAVSSLTSLSKLG